MELQSVKVTYPLKLVNMEYLTTESGKGDKNMNILVITDHFTRHVQAFIILNQSAKVTLKTLWEMFTVHYGLPEKILSD